MILQQVFLTEKLLIHGVPFPLPLPQKQMFLFLCSYQITCGSSPDWLLVLFHAYLSDFRS